MAPTSTPTVTATRTPSATPTNTLTPTPPRFLCEVISESLNLRSGPGIEYAPPLAGLPRGAQLLATGRNEPSTWITVDVVGAARSGWVSADERFVHCDFSTPNPLRIAPMRTDHALPRQLFHFYLYFQLTIDIIRVYRYTDDQRIPSLTRKQARSMTSSSSTNLTPAAVLQTGVDAQRAGKLDAAHRAYLLAARMLLDEARTIANPQQREQRIANANQIMARAREIETLLAKAQASRATAPTTPTTARSASSSSAPTVQPPIAEGDETPSWLLAERPRLRLADVAGLDDVKEQIHLKLIYPFTHRAAAERFRIRAGGGILLYGPPGVGKTYIARAIAGELQAAIFVAKASSLMSKWFGEAEKNIAALFAAARKEERAVIFLDEVEALVARRGGSNSSVMPRVISEFLAQTQSIGDEGGGAVLLLGATNEPWAIDPAALRPGRFDELIYVGLPDDVARLRLLQLNLRERPLAADVNLTALTARTAGYSGADIAYICTRASQRAFLDAVESGVERQIEMSDFDAVLAERQPSVTPAQLRRYEQFRVEREG